MINRQTQAQIFLADERGRSMTDSLLSEHTFNFGSYVAEGRVPFGSLCLFNDDTLRAGTTLRLRVEADTHVLLIPVTGGLEYSLPESIQSSASVFLEPGQAGHLALPANTEYTIGNPYETEYVNFLQIWITSQHESFTPQNEYKEFDLTHRNTLHLLAAMPDFRASIGQYDGRQEGTYLPENSQNGVFVFVLKGAFEVANRLMHDKDGLALRTAAEVEFEALSNDAILLIIDV